MGDLDNDGWKDIYVSNGLPQDFRNADQNKVWKKYDLPYLQEHYQEYIDQLPSEPLANYAYRNKGDLSFENATQSWGLELKGFTNGMAQCDLDRDGDLDLLLNNLQRSRAV